MNLSTFAHRLRGTKPAHPAGTLLCKGYTREPVEAPTAPANLSDVSLSGSPGYPPRLWNLTITATYYDPPFDPTFPTHRGWNLQPQKQLGVSTGTRYFYYATSSGNTSGLPLYDSIDFGNTDSSPGTGLFRCPPALP